MFFRLSTKKKEKERKKGRKDRRRMIAAASNLQAIIEGLSVNGHRSSLQCCLHAFALFFVPFSLLSFKALSRANSNVSPLLCNYVRVTEGAVILCESRNKLHIVVNYKSCNHRKLYKSYNKSYINLIIYRIVKNEYCYIIKPRF